MHTRSTTFTPEHCASPSSFSWKQYCLRHVWWDTMRWDRIFCCVSIHYWSFQNPTDVLDDRYHMRYQKIHTPPCTSITFFPSFSGWSSAMAMKLRLSNPVCRNLALNNFCGIKLIVSWVQVLMIKIIFKSWTRCKYQKTELLSMQEKARTFAWNS